MPEAPGAGIPLPARAGPAACLIPLLLFLSALLPRPAVAGPECVILLHGLTKDAASMVPLQQRLAAAGFHTVNIDYPSRKGPIQELAVEAVEAGLARCAQAGAAPVNFVTHSMGGLLVRYYYRNRSVAGLGRVVMLAPPNQGSRVGDWLDHIPWIKDVNGPAGRQMGTGEGSLPLQMGPVRFELGVITGDRSRNPFASAILEGPDDGRIRVESAKVEGMCAFYVVPLTHGRIMLDADVIEQSLRFLWRGYFVGETAREYACGH
ncbi:esterase/lipase family protein [Microbulbifer yueqingensis]|uniref:Alpha/beta hydrolase family protein n=1 Tax=Microbulbifer yueqingensis TaxID=658219 RepID=A0A1G9BFB2_9GAMM|nr:alpha/beta fold hydrolase [Microbulbifer yueqingensis]SDK37555.1 Alpha/beta hydrolase family protein [Microbulbifer yueqingensis]